MENNKISDYTFCPWMGCTKISPGCENCHAEMLTRVRVGKRNKTEWIPTEKRIKTDLGNWQRALKWNQRAEEKGRRYRILCAPLADVFEDHPRLHEWRLDLFQMIKKTPNLDWMLLTKRPENAVGMLSQHVFSQGLPGNLWIGASVEDQESAEKRIPHLLKVPAAVRFLSMEPLLGPVWLGEMYDHTTVSPGSVVMPFYHGIHWVIVGGESFNPRPMNPDWVRDIRDQCVAAGVPFFFTQGSFDNWPDHKNFYSFPPDLRIREYPNQNLPIPITWKEIE